MSSEAYKRERGGEKGGEKTRLTGSGHLLLLLVFGPDKAHGQRVTGTEGDCCDDDGDDGVRI